MHKGEVGLVGMETKGEGSVSCDGSFEIFLPDSEECTSNATLFAECELTVYEAEACDLELAEAPCSAYDTDACAPVWECVYGE